METNFNLGSLKIVYNPLMEYFKKIQEKVDKNINIINSKGYIEDELDYEDLDLFSKVQASLKMIGLNGLVHVLDLNQEAYEYTKGVSVENKLIIFTKIHQCLVKVDFYMQNLIAGSMDEPTKLFDVYKDLAISIDKEVFINDLFFPKLDLIRNNNTVELNKELRLGNVIVEENKNILLEGIKNYQNNCSNSLNVIFNFINKKEDFSSIEERNEFNVECRNLYNILSALQNYKISKSYYILFGLQKVLISIASPLSNESFKEVINEHGDELIKNIDSINRSLNVLITDISKLKNGEKTGSLKPNEKMVKNVMLFIINLTNNIESLKEMPVFKELNNIFSFDFYKKQLEGISLKVTLKQDNPDLLINLQNVLVDLKEEIIILTGKNLAENMFETHLNKIIGLLANFKNLASEESVVSDFINNFIITIKNIKDKNIVFNHDTKRELSLSVVFLELAIQEILSKEESNDYLKTELKLISNRLANLINQVDNNDLPLPSLDIVTKKDSEDKVLLTIFKELSQELSINEEVLDEIIRSDSVDEDDLIIVLKSLKNISGIFKMIGNARLSILVDNILLVWKQIKDEGIESIDKDLLTNSISWLSGLSLYVNACQENNIIEAEDIEFKILTKFKSFMGDKVNIEDIAHVSNVGELTNSLVDESPITNEVIKEDELEQKDNELSQIKDEPVIENEPEPVIEDEIVLNEGEVIDKVNIDDETTEFFFLEMIEVKETLLNSISSLKNNNDNFEELTTIRRAFHTIKGSGKMVGFMNMGDIAWVVEDKLNSVLATKEPISENMLMAIENIANKIFNWTNELEKNNQVIFNLENEKNNFISLFMIKNNQDINTAIESKQELELDNIKNEDLVQENKESQEAIENLIENNNDLKDENLVDESQESEEDIESLIEKVENNNDLKDDTPSVEVVPSIVEPMESDPLISNQLDDDIKDDFIVIGGKEISHDIYNVFKEEFVEKVKELKAYFSNINNVGSVISNDFMRNAHTLSSISKSINLISLSNIAQGIESLAVLSAEVQKGFTRIEMKSLKYIVDSLEYFENTNNDISENTECYNDIMETLLDLKEVLEKIETVQPVESDLDYKKLMTDEILNFFKSDNFSNILNEKINVSLEKINNKNSEENDFTDKFKEIQKSLEELKNSYNKDIKDLAIKTGYNRRDLKILNEAIKKKSSESDNGSSTDEMDLSEEDWKVYGVDNKSEKISLFLEKNSNLKIIFEEKVSTIENEIEEDIFDISKEEIESLFNNIDIILEKIMSDSISKEDINSLKRDIHTLKGSVRMYGNNKMGLIAHRLESLLDYIENHNINIKEIYEILELEIDKLKFLNDNIYISLNPTQANWLDNISSDGLTNDDVNLLPEVFNDKNNKKFNIQHIKVMSKILDNIINEAGEMRLSRTTLEGTVDNNKKFINDLRNSSLKIQKILKELELKADLEINSQEVVVNDHFDPLEFDRYTRLQELTRFMHEAVEDVKDSVTNIELLHKVQENTIIKQSILTDSMLDSLMDVRLVSVDSVADKFYKIVRLTAKDANKMALLSLSGEKHEVDRLVLERIQHPIEHLLRNCLIHGIELPEERKRIGKSPQGLIKIDISVDGSFIIFNIEDDGAGISVEKIKEKALEKGLIEHDVEYSKQELLELIFKPGFTTATLTQNAGRGIGMDVVRNEVLSLGGSIKIETEEGKGSQFVIALPLSVATNQAMLTTVEDKLFAIPAMFIDEVVSIKSEQLKAGYNNGFISFRKVKYPLYYLGHLSDVVSSKTLPNINNYNTLIVVSYLGQKIILHVDTLKTIEEVVIKSAGKILGKINGLLGLTLLGDGRQGLVVNPVLLVEHFNKVIKTKDNKYKVKDDSSKNKNKDKLNKKLTALVVDDSITIRRATSKFLEKNNFNVILAKDGEDALKKLQDNIPDIILSDIEMPVMDGFEFVKHIKNIAKFKEIPIIMITSRTANKHKELAFSLGANDFLGKPYQEEELIKTIKTLLES